MVCSNVQTVVLKLEGQTSEGPAGDDVMGPFPHEFQGDEEDDDKADPGDPAALFEQGGDEAGGEAHQDDGDAEACDHDPGVFAGGAGDGEDVVEAHGEVGQHDLQHGLAHRLGWGGAGGVQCAHTVGRTQLAVHLPADPEQQNAAGEQQPDNGQELQGDQCQADAQDGGEADAGEDGASLLVIGQAGDGHSDDDCVVAGQDQVDEQDLEQGGERRDVECQAIGLASGVGGA